MKTGSNELMRDINSGLVLSLIIQECSISRADISKKLGLTRATVSAITEDLKQQGLIAETGFAPSKTGRKAVLYHFNQNHAYTVSIDLGPDTIIVLCTDLLGQEKMFYTVQNHFGREEILDHLVRILENAASYHAFPGHLCGISLAIHGTTFQNEVTFCTYSPYEGLPFYDTLSKAFQVPVYIENEANLSAIGEHTFCSHSNSIIFVSVHSGIGMGILIDNELFTGFNGKSGELGHSIVEINGRPCPCGNYGCLEQYASEQAVLKDFCHIKGLSECDRNTFLEACRQSDPAALAILNQFETYMTICVNNILNMFNPEVIVINSFLTAKLPESLERIRAGLQNQMKHYCILLPSMLRDQAPLLGGACLCTKNYLKLPELNLTKYF
ncbi:MAG: ROK family transcriptional regulator [Eubacterium sp.]|nr:ROK family transcriptional regulator [Eubacterium sp.]